MTDITPVEPTLQQPDRLEIGAQAESALQAVRMIMGVMALMLAAAVRPDGLELTSARLGVVLALIVATVVVLNLLGLHAGRSLGFKVISQIADIAATFGMVALLDEPLGHLSWVLLIIPMVSATVRFGAVATLLTWIAASAMYVGAAVTGVIAEVDQTWLIRIPGLLLAVAITVSVLARWMREGWELQNDLTENIAARERRLAAIETATRSFHHLDTDETLQACAGSALDLGFDAATIARDGTVVFAVGSAPVIGAETPVPERGRALTTVWMKESGRVFSVAVIEPQTESTIVGWSAEPPTRDHAESLASLVGHASIAIENTSLMQNLQTASNHDALTGLLNRRGLDETLDQLSSGMKFAAAFLDLDDLKSINDRYGHQVGDTAIAAFARRVESAAGNVGYVARIGGDEFVIIVPDGRLDDVAAIGTSVLDAVSRPVAIGPRNLPIGVSIGIAAAEAPVDLDRLVSRADEAAYQAKAHGKNQVVALANDGSFRRVLHTPDPAATIV